MSKKYINLISYFGGKYPHLQWLTSKFPAGNDEVVNLFRVLRDQYDEFTRLVYFTPFSRAELNNIITDCLNGKKVSDVERARRYFVKSQLGYGANGSQNNHYGTGFEWVLHDTNYYRVDNWNLKLKKLVKIVEKLRHFQPDVVNGSLKIQFN